LAILFVSINWSISQLQANASNLYASSFTSKSFLGHSYCKIHSLIFFFA
jgi:hypothetical protein